MYFDIVVLLQGYQWSYGLVVCLMNFLHDSQTIPSSACLASSASFCVTLG